MNKWKLCSVFLFCMVLASCSQKEELVDAEPNYTNFSTKKKHEESVNNNQSNINNADESNSGKEQNNDLADDTPYYWPYDLDFNGITITEDSNLATHTMNYKLSSPYSSLLSYDEKNEILYYINYGRDNYIYSFKDGVSTLLVEKAAGNLIFWEDSLYFTHIVDNQSIDNEEGIYRYNLDKKELKRIIEGEVDNLFIDHNGMYYTAASTDGTSVYYAVRPMDSIPQEVPYIYGPSYHEYQILYSNQGIYLLNTKTQDKIEIAPQDYIIERPFLCSHYFGFIKDKIIYVLNLLDGQTYLINPREHMYNKKIPSLYIYDVLIVNNILYINIDKSIIKYSLNDGTGVEYPENEEDDNESFIVISIYTDGNEIYGLASARDFSNSLLKLTMGDSPESFVIGSEVVIETTPTDDGPVYESKVKYIMSTTRLYKENINN